MSVVTTPKEFRTRRVPKPSPVEPSQISQMYQLYESHTHVHEKNYSHEDKKQCLQSSYPATPRTPRRDNSDSNKSGAHPYEHGSTQNIRSKNKPKNAMTPPMSKRPQNKSPRNSFQPASISSKTVRTPTTAAYAGPTFHASPAPSTLPIPSFYSKSTPESPGIKSQQLPKDDQIIPPTVIQLPNQTSSHSPITIFHQSKREQKDMTHSSPSSITATTSGSIFHNEVSRYSERSSFTIGAKNHFKPTASAKLSMELGEYSDSCIPYGAPFSTPYSERIKAIRPDNYSKSLPPESNNQLRSGNAEALKAYLFSGQLISTFSNSSGNSQTGSCKNIYSS